MIQSGKDAWKRARFYGRLATARRRSLPDVVILGAMRAGTTSLLRWLAQHPQILRSRKKEVHYFDVNFHRGELWYRAHFPRIEAADTGTRILESSPYYLFHPLAPERLAATLPEARLVALLRNPVDRALSHYYHEIRKGREDRNVLEAMQIEEERLAGEEEHILRDGSYVSRPHRRFSYKARGIYVAQLRRWEPWLRDGRLRLVQSEDLYRDPGRVLGELFEFVGVDPDHRPPDLRPRNVGGYPREKVGGEVLEYLAEFFRPHNAALEDFLGRDFGWNAL